MVHKANYPKCKRCKKPAIVALPSHNTAFCAGCFDLFFLNGVKRALKFMALPADALIGIAVSGGKDSLATWDVLSRLGHKVMGIHINLGIPDFSKDSIRAVTEFAGTRGLEYRIYNLKDLIGYDLPQLKGKTRYNMCALCGMIKRYYINRLAVENHFKFIATGHNLDDEAARLLGNILRHKRRYIEKFYPCLLSSHPRQAGRIKPLFRMDEHEIRTYVKIHGIVPAKGGCPMNKGATSHYYKEAMDLLEKRMPGSKRDFLYGFLKEQQPPQPASYRECSSCGEPTFQEVCGVCRLKASLHQEQKEK